MKDLHLHNFIFYIFWRHSFMKLFSKHLTKNFNLRQHYIQLCLYTRSIDGMDYMNSGLDIRLL